MAITGKENLNENIVKFVAGRVSLASDLLLSDFFEPFACSCAPEKINVKFHKNCENTGKILKISYVRCHFVKFDIHFLGLS